MPGFPVHMQDWLCARRFLRDPRSNKKILYYPSVKSVDRAIISYIQSNGGKNNILVVRSLASLFVMSDGWRHTCQELRQEQVRSFARYG